MVEQKKELCWAKDKNKYKNPSNDRDMPTENTLTMQNADKESNDVENALKKRGDNIISLSVLFFLFAYAAR